MEEAERRRLEQIQAAEVTEAARWWASLNPQEQIRIAYEQSGRQQRAKEAADARLEEERAVQARQDEQINELGQISDPVERLLVAVAAMGLDAKPLMQLCPELIPLHKAPQRISAWFAARAGGIVPTDAVVDVSKWRNGLFGRSGKLVVVARENAWEFPDGAICGASSANAFVLETGRAVVQQGGAAGTVDAVLGERALIQMAHQLDLIGQWKGP